MVNSMIQVACPLNDGAPTWANSCKLERGTGYRCTKCGSTSHERAKEAK